MPWVHFVNLEVLEEFKKIENNSKNEKTLFEEHNFIAMCLKIGLSINDLEKLTYVDVLKILFCYIDKKENVNVKKATQNDWDKLKR